MIQSNRSYEMQWLETISSPLQRAFPIRSIRKSNEDDSLLLVSDIHSSLDWRSSHFSSPKRYIWLPQRDDHNAPTPISEIATVFRDSIVNLLIHIDGGYFCAGPVALGAVVHRENGVTEIEFSLNAALSREWWVRLGGYLGWVATLDNKDLTNLTSADDIENFIFGIEKRANVRVRITRYEDDFYSVFQFGNQAVIVYQDKPSSSFVSVGDNQSRTPVLIEFNYAQEVHYEFSSQYVIHRDQALSMLKSFLAKGEPFGLIPFSHR